MDPPTPYPELINFCLQPLVDISSTAVSADDHPLSNLVSINPSARSKGFRVERFIRPPVQLDFEFRQVPVNVACIILQPELAPHSEMRLEVAASFHTASVCSNLVKICPNTVVKDNQTLLLLENRAFKKRDGGVFSISKTDLTSCQVEGSYMSQSVLSRARVTVQPLKHPNILSRLRQLTLTVTRITGPKPLALKSLEVWGSPSRDSSCTAPTKLDCLWSCLAAVGKERTGGSSDGVNLYYSKNSSPEQDTVTANDLHRSYANMCSCARDQQETMSSHAPRVHEVEREREHGRLSREECQCRSQGVQRGPVFGGVGTNTQEVVHIKEPTNENKKSLKPQQRAARGAHLHGCSHNIGQGKQKPGPSSSSSGGSSCRSGSHRGWLEGKNGSPPSTSSLLLQQQPNHNTSGRDHDSESISQRSCGQWSGTNRAAIDGQHKHHQQQQRRRLEDAQTLPTESGSMHDRREVPSEFLDKITYEVMQIPMLLPSGHCVDRSTVERLGNNDALYGRPPTDPFTGIPFSETTKPEFFPELKLRLDRFLSSLPTATTATATSTSARTLGTADQIAAHLYRVGHSGGDGRRRDRGEDAGEEGSSSSEEPPPKKSRSMKERGASHGNGDVMGVVGTQNRQFPIEQTAPGGSGCHSAAVRTGAGAVWACPTTGSPSYGRGSAGAPIKDQRTTHRMPRHGQQQQRPSSSSTQPNHNFQQVRNQFEEEVAGSLDQALRQLLSD